MLRAFWWIFTTSDDPTRTLDPATVRVSRVMNLDFHMAIIRRLASYGLMMIMGTIVYLLQHHLVVISLWLFNLGWIQPMSSTSELVSAYVGMTYEALASMMLPLPSIFIENLKPQTANWMPHMTPLTLVIFSLDAIWMRLAPFIF